jgi:hypothetical protein
MLPQEMVKFYFMATNNNNLVMYDINQISTQSGYDFFYWNTSDDYSDISTLCRVQGTNQILLNGNGIYQLDFNKFFHVSDYTNNILEVATSSLVTTSVYANKLLVMLITYI